MKRTLSKKTFEKGIRVLAHQDADLAGILEIYGPPPMWNRKPGFATLLYIILEQQVSLASARAAYARLLDVASPLTPKRFLELDGDSLRRIGFSRQKTGYARGLARSIESGGLNLSVVGRMSDGAARRVLLEQRGIGPWSADIYLLQALRRPDVWPNSDLALIVAIQDLRGLDERPGFEEVEEIGEPWRPWRAVAARMLWHYYLSRRRGSEPNGML
ncbi:MAG: DNA-3-methyladenine glycosylase 2 family protein [Candidatus Latescibacterota bacterium]|nr:MAG: DNA-3-methyladenine glycosylase 2 family protein [Candidatus Latescibacterota bacterium]